MPAAVPVRANNIALVEQYRNGYPRLAAFVAADPSFAIVRRFGDLFARDLLLKQDRLSVIEAQLQQIDSLEETQWFLSSRRGDRRNERLCLLSELSEALRDYERAISSYHYMLSLPKPSSMSKRDVDRWMNGNKPLVQPEAEFLNHEEDLISLAPTQDIGEFDEVVERMLDKYLPLELGYSV